MTLGNWTLIFNFCLYSVAFTCHSLHPSCLAKRNSVTELCSCQNCKQGTNECPQCIPVWTSLCFCSMLRVRKRPTGQTYVAKKEKRQKKSESSPHPGLESLCAETWHAWHTDATLLSMHNSRTLEQTSRRTAQGGPTRVTSHLHCSADVCSCHSVSPLA